MHREQPVSLSSDNLFRTPSPLVAAWLSYSKRVQYMHYESNTRNFVFFEQTHGICDKLIQDYNQVDPTASIRRFFRVYHALLQEKNQADARIRKVKESLEVANGNSTR